MKVGIITRHAVANYGSILQAYATQRAIEKIGHQSEIINYIRKDEHGFRISSTMLKRNKTWNSNMVKRIIYLVLQTPIYASTFYAFRRFARSFVKESAKEYSTSEDLAANVDMDVYCTGSDQVWGMIGNDEYDENYFLSFVPEQKKCIAYAASFGKETLSDELMTNLPRLIGKYTHIGVRENSAKEIIEHIGFESTQVLDPTLLLTKEDWESVIKGKVNSEGYVLTYQLHENKNIEKYAEKFAKKANKKLIRISVSLLYAAKSGELAFMPSPEEFLELFKKADFVITDSFHATVFSIIFEKNFIDVLPLGTGTRITSLLELLGLKDRVVSDFTDFSLMYNQIDYTPVNQKLDFEREKSLRYLKYMIEN